MERRWNILVLAQTYRPPRGRHAFYPIGRENAVRTTRMDHGPNSSYRLSRAGIPEILRPGTPIAPKGNIKFSGTVSFMHAAFG